MSTFYLRKFDENNVRDWFWDIDINFWMHDILNSKRKICEVVHVLNEEGIKVVMEVLESWDGPLNSFAYFEIRKRLCEHFE